MDGRPLPKPATSTAYLRNTGFLKTVENYLMKNLGIKNEPGVHFSALMKSFNLSSGSLSHHINLLENEEYIKSRQDGMYRRFYLHEEKARLVFNLSTVQERILKIILDNPGISQSRISKMIDSNKMRVNYHVKILRDADLLKLERNGRESLCFITNYGREFIL